MELVATTDATVLIDGGTGTDKELIARALHHFSARRTLNCAAIRPTSWKANSPAHEKGVFTGALTQRLGRFELAKRGGPSWTKSATPRSPLQNRTDLALKYNSLRSKYNSLRSAVLIAS